MSKRIKNLMTDELRSRYAEADNALLVELVGCDGVTTNLLRRELREKQMRIEIVKNAMFRRAVAEGPLRVLSDHLDGPVAVVTGGDSLIDVAKLVDEWMPRIKGLRLRAAVIEGEFVDEHAVGGLAKMPNKRDMQSRLASIAMSPGANLVSAILAGGGNIAGCLKTVIEKLENGEELKKSA